MKIQVRMRRAVVCSMQLTLRKRKTFLGAGPRAKGSRAPFHYFLPTTLGDVLHCAFHGPDTVLSPSYPKKSLNPRTHTSWRTEVKERDLGCIAPFCWVAGHRCPSQWGSFWDDGDVTLCALGSTCLGHNQRAESGQLSGRKSRFGDFSGGESWRMKCRVRT